MITRAQAEALLTLAESLEACERLGIELPIDEEGMAIFFHGSDWVNLYKLTGMEIRMAVSSISPKQET